MKCAVCGKEFGSGINCQNCGTDRVTGLANYSGYGNHAGNSNHNSSEEMEYVFNKTTACYACGEIIPIDAEYCPYCGKKLYENCPKCGKKNSSQFEYCPKCGTNIFQYYQVLKDNGGYASNTMVCYVCSEIVPANSMFCPYCKKELLVTCPKCGKLYSTLYSVCNKCGTGRHDYYLK